MNGLLLAGLVLATVSGSSARFDAGSVFATESPPKPVRTSSTELVVGASCEQGGDHLCAKDAYRRAFEGFPHRKQRGDEGAQAAILCAESGWRAFMIDSDAAHLRDGIEILERWIEVAGPGSRASKLPQVRRAIGRLRAIAEPIMEAQEAMAHRDPSRADERVDEALEAMSRHRLAWKTAARVELWLVSALISTHRDALTGGEEPGFVLIDQASRRLDECEKRQPEEDADSAEAKELGRLRKVLGQLREELDPETVVEDDPPIRPWPVALFSTGVIAAGAGAALIGEAMVFRRVAGNEVERLETAAASDRPNSEDAYQSNRFRIRGYEEAAARRNLGLIIGGSILAAGGISMAAGTLVPAIRYLRDRGRRRGRERELDTRMRFGTALSPHFISLSLNMRF